MPSISLHLTTSESLWDNKDIANNLPTVLQTPSGLAIIEIQGTIHAPFPQQDAGDVSLDQDQHSPSQTPIGRLEFPLFDPTSDAADQKWMKRVYLYVGKHQRLTGEVKKLSKPLLVVGKRAEETPSYHVTDTANKTCQKDELEILEVIRHKILFGGRPEPVGD